MKKIEFKHWISSITFLCFFFVAQAQVEVQVTITNGESTTTCTDLLSVPNPMWSVNIENEGWVEYPFDGLFCHTDFPNLQYTASYVCPSDVPMELELCFRAYENDQLNPLNCDPVPDCLVELCQNFSIPALGLSADFLLELADGQDSDGSVNFTIETINLGATSNDFICDAIDLGVLPNGGTLGDNTVGSYNNLCATSMNDPNPLDDNSWFNNAGVWFSFTTGPDEFGHLNMVEVLNDPEGTGEEIDVQIAIYESDDGTCNGNLSLRASLSDNSGLNGALRLSCLDPNTTYFIMIDGGSAGANTEQGIFGLQVRNLNVPEGGDLPCDASDFGEIPENGTASIGPQSNFCADDTDDPNVSGFISQHSVWFSFIAPASGHVLIEGLSEGEELPLGIQLALYRSLSGNCNGIFQQVASEFTEADLNESFQITCLFPGDTYFLLVDGSGSNPRGVFNMQISDAGDITPVTDQDITLCAGETLVVGTTIYDQTGVYTDTLNLFAGCDSIVNTTLTVLDELVLTVEEISPAIGLGNNNAVYEASAEGGAGNYTFSWCNGETSPVASSLVGGDQCCVTVTDDNGCIVEFCFEVAFTLDIVPTFTEDLLDCFGDQDGVITFSAVNGVLPYSYFWQNDDNSISGSGTINFEGEEITLQNLPAGDYTIRIEDQFDDTTFVAMVTEPDELTVELINTQDASCFAFCDGQIEVTGIGGTGAYQYAWSGGLPGINAPNTACAGSYTVTVTDENGCTAEFSIDIGQPEEFIATAIQDQAVSCFEGSDGIASVSTNGDPISYEWNTTEDTDVIENLEAGFYTVIVTNADGCQATSTIEITEPSGPLQASIDLDEAISCNGAADGALRANISGPGTSFTYQWSDGQNQAIADDLGPGNYTLLIRNEKGCEATAEFMLEEPEEITAAVSETDVTCLDPENGGSVRLEDVQGGVPPYSYSLDGVMFDIIPAFAGLFPGQYEPVIQDASGCERSYPVEILGPPEVTVTLGEDLEISLGDTVELVAFTNSTNPVFSWEPKVDTLASEDGSSIIVMPLISSAYSVTVLDTATLCRATDDIFISIDKNRKVYIPNAFSPNLDGLNDYFMIHGGFGIAEVKNFQVYSRNGMLVHEAVNFMPETIENGWDGTFRGQPMNSGVYVYMAEITFIDGQTELFKGDVMLVR